MTTQVKRIVHAVLTALTGMFFVWLLAFARTGGLICVEGGTALTIVILAAGANAAWGVVLRARWNTKESP